MSTAPLPPPPWSALASRRRRGRGHFRRKISSMIECGTVAENLVRAVSGAPHVTAVFEADFSTVAAHKAAMAARGRGAGYAARCQGGG